MKKKVGTLLAVTLATAAPAIAEPMATPDPWATTQAPPVTPSRNVQAEQLVDRVLAMFGIAAPRRLPSGAPACGNVQSKSQSARCVAERRAANDPERR